jgi:hypothetical protein
MLLILTTAISIAVPNVWGYLVYFGRTALD